MEPAHAGAIEVAGVIFFVAGIAFEYSSSSR
jgi:hypothetical protein